ERQGGFAIAQRKEGCFLAVEKFLNDEVSAGRAELAAENQVDGSFGFGDTFGHHDALAGRKAVGLDDDRRATVARISLGLAGRVKALIGGARYTGRAAQILGEALGTLKLCGGAARPESLDARGLKIIHDTGAKWRFRSNDDKIDAIFPAKGDDRRMIRRVERDAFRFLRYAGIAGCAK